MSLADLNAKFGRKPADPPAPNGQHLVPVEPPIHSREDDPPLREPDDPALLGREPTLVVYRPPDTRITPISDALPHSDDAERAVLGMMINPVYGDCISEVVRRVGRKHFHSPAHETIFSIMLERFNENEPVDLITVTQDLNDRKLLESVGGASYLTKEIYDCPVGSDVGWYLDIVREKYAQRELKRMGMELVERSRDAGSFEEISSLVVDITRSLEFISAGDLRKSRLPAFEDASLFLGENLPADPPELISGVLHQGSKIIFGGTSKGRKTWSLMDMAISVATGVDFWGFKCRKGRVAYINFEIQRSFAFKRLQQICSAKQVTLEEGSLMMVNLRGLVAGMETLTDDLITMLENRGFVLIVVDPIYKALGDRDENAAGDVASLCNELERIAVTTGAAIAWGAHYSKGNQAAKESIDRIGGSGVWARDPDSILTMTAHENEESFTVDNTLRNFAPMDPFVVKWAWPLFYRDTDADPKALKQPKGRTTTVAGDAMRNAEEMLLLLSRGPLHYGEWKRLAREQCGFETKAFEKYVAILKNNNRSIKTDAGWMILADSKPPYK